MPTPVIADVFRVVFTWSLTGNGRTAVNVMHFSAPGKTATDVLDALDAHVTPSMYGLSAGDATITKVSAQPLDGTTAAEERAPGWSGSKSGAGGSQGIPQACHTITLKTGHTGRSNRGRIYLPDIGEGEQSNGLIDAGDMATELAAWVTFANAMETAGVALGVASYKLAAWRQATTLQSHTHTQTQRRRNRPL